LISTVLFTGILTLAIKPMEKANEKISNFVMFIVRRSGIST